jgi:competence ComEA-like helix-hairpin-helix protein
MFRAIFTKFVAVPLACFAVLSAGATIQGQTAPTKSAPKAKATTKVLLDLNTATVDELEEHLSGVGPATAKKIVAGRPYSSVDDLAKAGVSNRVIESIRDQVSVGAETAAKSKTASSKTTKPKADDAKESTTGKVNLNTADAAALEALPGIGAATAKAIIAARPIKSIDELDKIRGLGKNRIEALRNLVTTADEPAPTAAKTAPAPTSAKTTVSTKATPKTPAGGQKVDINTAAKEDLDTLPGIGPVKAQAIIEARPFKTIEDIMKVKGIKEGEFSKIRELITVK